MIMSITQLSIMRFYERIICVKHIHNARDSRPFEDYKKLMQQRGFPYRCYNVGCMLYGYKPVTLEQLMKG